MRNLILALFVLATCTGWSSLSAIIDAWKSGGEPAVIEVIENTDPPFENTAGIVFDHDYLEVSKDIITQISVSEALAVPTNDLHSDGWVIDPLSPYATEEELYAVHKGNVTELMKHLIRAEVIIAGYKVNIFATAKEDIHGDVTNWRLNNNHEGFEGDDLGFTDEAVKINNSVIVMSKTEGVQNGKEMNIELLIGSVDTLIEWSGLSLSVQGFNNNGSKVWIYK